MKNLFDSIISLLENEKLHLRSDFTIEKMAAILNTNSQAISAAIEKYTYMDFDSVIKFYRIEEAKKIMEKERPNWSLGTISKSCGFSNNVSFFRAFQEVTGETPFKYFLNNFCQEVSLNSLAMN